MDLFFEPDNVAIIGASNNSDKLGYTIMKNMLDAKFFGRIYPINPKEEGIFGLHTYASILNVPEEIDLAILIIPANGVLKAVNECAKKGVKYIMVESAGFSESGEEGCKLEKEVLRIAKENKVRIIGPNCLGSINTANNLVSIFVTYQNPKKGSMAIVAQSGGIGLLLMDWVCENVGLSKFIGLGNKCDIDEADLLSYLCTDPETGIIMIYMEGIKDGRKLINTARTVTKEKPVIVLKAGQFDTGMQAAMSHTGSIAGDSAIADAAFKQTSIIRADTLEELFDYAKCLAYQPLMKGDNVAVVSTSGGHGVVAADACGRYGLNLGCLSEETLREIRTISPALSKITNPIDLGEVAGDYETYYKIIKTVLKDDNIDGMVIITVFWVEALEKVIEKLKEIRKGFIEKPIVFCGIDGVYIISGIEGKIKSLEDESIRIPVYPSPERGVRALAVLRKYEKLKRRKLPTSPYDRDKALREYYKIRQ